VSSRTTARLAAALGTAAAAVAFAAAVLGVQPAQALPSYKSACSTCHSAAPSGSVTAAPSRTTLSPGEAYTVNVSVGLTAGGQTGYWISEGDTATPAVSLAAGPAASPFVVTMTAPGAAGTYTYKVWGAKGKPSSGGMATSTTYQVTVAGGTGGGGGGGGGGAADTQPPVISLSGAAGAAWYRGAVSVILNAADNAGGTGVDFIRYALDGAAPVKVPGATARIDVSGDGPHTIWYAATDLSANTEVPCTLTLNIDGTAPTATVLGSAKVKRGARAAVKYRVADTPGTGAAVTTIVVRNKAGKAVKTLKSAAMPVNAAQSVRFTCKLPRGVYRVTATATDKAGNVSAVSATRRLTVR
jgi:hypothetical protein